eukprot:482757_1
MSLSQTQLETPNNNNNNNANTNDIQNIESHFNAFYSRFKQSFEDIPLGYINIEKSIGYDQMSWLTIRTNIESLARCDHIEHISSDILSNLLLLIDKQLSCSMEIKLVTPPHVPFQNDIDNVSKGITTAIIALYIMTAKNIKRELIQQDILNKIMKLITFHIINNFTPVKDSEQRIEYKHCFNIENGHENNDIKKNKKKNKSRKKTSNRNKNKNKTKTKNKSKDKNNKIENNEEISYWKDINIQMDTFLGDFCSLLILMNIYCEKEIMREQLITELLNCCFNAFEIQNINDIQDGCKSLIVTIFVKYEQHRQEVCDRILDYYRNTERIYYSKREIALSSMNKENNFIHLINMLILEMCQSLSTKMLLNKQKELRQIQLMNTPNININKYTNKNNKNINKYILFEQSIIKPINDCKKTVNNIIKGIIGIVTNSELQNKDDKLKMFYKDLENVCDLTEWPVAEYALAVIMKAFHSYLICENIQKKKI